MESQQQKRKNVTSLLVYTYRIFCGQKTLSAQPPGVITGYYHGMQQLKPTVKQGRHRTI